MVPCEKPMGILLAHGGAGRAAKGTRAGEAGISVFFESFIMLTSQG